MAAIASAPRAAISAAIRRGGSGRAAPSARKARASAKAVATTASGGAIAELRRLSRSGADGNSEGLALLTKCKAHVRRFVGERQGAAVIDQKAEFGGQPMQIPRGGERGLNRAGDRADVDCVRRGRPVGSP